MTPFALSVNTTSFLLDFLSFLAIVSGILVITAKNPVTSVLFLISVFLNISGYLVLLGTAYLGLAYLIIYVGAIAILFLFVIMMMNLKIPSEEIKEVEESLTGSLWQPGETEKKKYVSGLRSNKNLPLAIVLGTLFLFEILSVLPLTTPLCLPAGGRGGVLWPYLNYSSTSFPFFPFINNALNAFFVYPAQENVSEKLDVSSNNWYNSVESIHSVGLNTDTVYMGYPLNATEETFNSFLQIQSIGQGLYTHTSMWLMIASVIFLLAMVGPILLCMSEDIQGK